MKRSFKKIMVLLVAFILAIGTVGIPDTAEAKVKVGTPKMKKWYESYNSKKDPKHMSAGVRYTIKWSKVKGASGYQVQRYERIIPDPVYGSPGKWYKFPTVSQKGRSTSIGFSVHLEFKARVRAYKIVNGRRVYGKWSKFVSKKVLRW